MATHECELFVIESNALELEEERGVWQEGHAQLNEYLENLAKGHGRRVFGAIAVGKTVRFYEWDSGAEEIQNLAEIDECFYLDGQCQTVEVGTKFNL
ncbi:hypothetical protein AJ80_02276 [Polytolypa hystricis UAMH7299]|uniref:Uncharacterized protein n=1 Tax=Polytolypa hystricis (strain UAMH7299) TaxID=1447883 RepID=A0A2B7YR67_POLH7|nr:hypothetical protein AJ80_02276 [Polytolypa hystricis UAMH7299]